MKLVCYHLQQEGKHFQGLAREASGSLISVTINLRPHLQWIYQIYYKSHALTFFYVYYPHSSQLEIGKLQVYDTDFAKNILSTRIRLVPNQSTLCPIIHLVLLYCTGLLYISNSSLTAVLSRSIRQLLLPHWLAVSLLAEQPATCYRRLTCPLVRTL